MLRPNWMFMASIRKQTNQCAQYKLKIVTKHDSRNTQVSMFLLRNIRVAINFAGMLLLRCMLRTWDLHDCLRITWESKPVNVHSMHITKFWPFFLNKIKFLGFHAVDLCRINSCRTYIEETISISAKVKIPFRFFFLEKKFFWVSNQ